MTPARETFTIFGASGFIGRNLCARLHADGYHVHAVRRNDPLPKARLGHVIYAIGMTADFRQQPLETMQAHVGVLASVLEDAECQSFTYLSSTRVYGTAHDTSEDAAIETQPGDADHLYDLSKMAGESLTLHGGGKNPRVVRLSNVVGPPCDSPNFLDSIIRNALGSRRVIVRSHPQSCKDYVWLDDVLDVLPIIAISGRQPIYNIAGGVALSHREILDVLCRQTGCSVEFHGDHSPIRRFAVDIERARNEFGFAPRSVLSQLPALMTTLKRPACAA